MADQGDSAQKEFEPTPKKLADARKKGEVPRSTDLNTSASYAGLLVAGAVFGSATMTELGAILAAFVDRAPEISADIFAGGGTAAVARSGFALAAPIAPWVVLPFVLVLLSTIAQQSFVIAPEKLKPKLDRISPLSNAKNKFGRQGLFEFAKSTTKLAIFCLVLGGFLYSRNDTILGALSLDPIQTSALFGKLSLDFVAFVFVISMCIGIVDFGWQYFEHIRKNRMTRQELMDESKQSEGDPHMRQKRRQRAQEIATNRMLSDVPKASVIVVNPTHYATALRWDRSSPGAPICVAKGVDEIAARIREIAEKHNVPIYRDPPTARAIHALVDVGHEIHPDHYRAVAAAIRFADTMRSKARKTWGEL